MAGGYDVQARFPAPASLSGGMERGSDNAVRCLGARGRFGQGTRWAVRHVLLGGEGVEGRRTPGGFQRLSCSSPRRRWQHRSAIEVTNEPILEFKPGSPERAALQKVTAAGDQPFFWGGGVSLRSWFLLLVLHSNPRLFPRVGGSPVLPSTRSFPLGTVGSCNSCPHPSSPWAPHTQGTERSLSPGFPLLVGLGARMDGAGGGGGQLLEVCVRKSHRSALLLLRHLLT